MTQSTPSSGAILNRKSLNRQSEQKLLITQKEAAHLLSMSERKFQDLVRAGVIPSVKLGHRTVRIPMAGLERAISDLVA